MDETHTDTKEAAGMLLDNNTQLKLLPSDATPQMIQVAFSEAAIGAVVPDKHKVELCLHGEIEKRKAVALLTLPGWEHKPEEWKARAMPVKYWTCVAHGDSNSDNSGYDAISATEIAMRGLNQTHDQLCALSYAELHGLCKAPVQAIMSKGKIPEGGARRLNRETSKMTTICAGLKNNRNGKEFHDWGRIEQGDNAVTDGNVRFMGGRYGIHGRLSMCTIYSHQKQKLPLFVADKKAETGRQT